jgi:hypothetical protein
MVTDERHRPGAEFVVEVCRIGGMKERFLIWWVAGMTHSVRRQRLHGWRLWQGYSVENGLEPAEMVRLSNPALEVAYFVQAMSQMGTPFYLIKESMTAIKELFEIAAPWVLALLKESLLLRQALRAAVTGMVRGARYREIWDLTDLFNYIK